MKNELKIRGIIIGKISLTSLVVINVPTRAPLAVETKGLLFLWLANLNNKSNVCKHISSLQTDLFEIIIQYCSSHSYSLQGLISHLNTSSGKEFHCFIVHGIKQYFLSMKINFHGRSTAFKQKQIKTNKSIGKLAFCVIVRLNRKITKKTLAMHLWTQPLSA